MSPKPEALVFDFEGVIADTEPLYWRAWSEILGARNIALDWDSYCRIGRGIRDEKMLDAIPELAADPALRESIRLQLPARRELVRSWISERIPVSRETIRLLKSLDRYKLGIVTTSKRPEVEPILLGAGIRDCFAASVFGEDTLLHKPNAGPYLLMRQRLSIQGDAIAFEDSDAGIVSAATAGFRTIRVAAPDDLSRLVEAQLNWRQ